MLYYYTNILDSQYCYTILYYTILLYYYTNILDSQSEFRMLVEFKRRRPNFIYCYYTAAAAAAAASATTTSTTTTQPNSCVLAEEIFVMGR